MNREQRRAEPVEVLVLKVDEAARLLMCSTDTIYRLVAEGKMPSVRVGHALRIPKDGLMRFVNGGEPAA